MKKNKNTLRQIEKKIYNAFYLKYFFDPIIYNTYIIENIIFNEKSHIVSLFKDNLIYDDECEFFKKFYNINNVYLKFRKILEYNENYCVLYPNYAALPQSKFFYENLNKKQKLLDEQENGKKNIRENSGLKDNSENIIFDESTYNSIIKNNGNLCLSIFGLEKESQNNSVSDTGDLVSFLDKLDEEHNCANNVRRKSNKIVFPKNKQNYTSPEKCLETSPTENWKTPSEKKGYIPLYSKTIIRSNLKKSKLCIQKQMKNNNINESATKFKENLIQKKIVNNNNVNNNNYIYNTNNNTIINNNNSKTIFNSGLIKNNSLYYSNSKTLINISNNNNSNFNSKKKSNVTLVYQKLSPISKKKEKIINNNNTLNSSAKNANENLQRVQRKSIEKVSYMPYNCKDKIKKIKVNLKQSVITKEKDNVANFQSIDPQQQLFLDLSKCFSEEKLVYNKNRNRNLAQSGNFPLELSNNNSINIMKSINNEDKSEIGINKFYKTKDTNKSPRNEDNTVFTRKRGNTSYIKKNKKQGESSIQIKSKKYYKKSVRDLIQNSNNKNGKEKIKSSNYQKVYNNAYFDPSYSIYHKRISSLVLGEVRKKELNNQNRPMLGENLRNINNEVTELTTNTSSKDIYVPKNIIGHNSRYNTPSYIKKKKMMLLNKNLIERIEYDNYNTYNDENNNIGKKEEVYNNLRKSIGGNIDSSLCSASRNSNFYTKSNDLVNRIITKENVIKSEMDDNSENKIVVIKMKKKKGFQNGKEQHFCLNDKELEKNKGIKTRKIMISSNTEYSKFRTKAKINQKFNNNTPMASQPKKYFYQNY